MIKRAIFLACVSMFFSGSVTGSENLVGFSFLEKGKLLRCINDSELNTKNQCYEDSEDQYDPLIIAAYTNDVDYLTGSNFNQNFKKNLQESEIISHVLSIAAGADSFDFLKIFLEEILEIKQLTLSHWNELNRIPGFELEHPIFESIRAGNIGVLVYFINSGVPLNLKTKNGLTFVSFALLSRQPRSLAFLLGYGIKDSCKRKFLNGKTVEEVSKQLKLDQYLPYCNYEKEKNKD